MNQDPTLVGSVHDVHGARVSVSLGSDSLSGLKFVEGQGYRIGQIGSFVRIPVGYLNLFGVVSQVGAGAAPAAVVSNDPGGYRWMTVQLVGEAQAGEQFQRGVSQFPTVGDSVHLVADADLDRIYGRDWGPGSLRLGHLASSEAIPALLDANKLVTRHCAVVGATGTGKSTTVVSLLKALSDPTVFESARILVFDVHGEYSRPLRQRATVFSVSPNAANSEEPLFIPYWALTSDELLPIALGSLDENGRAAVVERLLALKQEGLWSSGFTEVTQEQLTADTPTPFSLHKLWFDFHRQLYGTHTVAGGPNQSFMTEALEKDPAGNPMQPGDPLKVIPPKYRQQTQAAGADKVFVSGSTLNIRRQIDTLASRLRDPRLSFLFDPGPWRTDINGAPGKDLDELIAGWIGGPRPVSVLDLSGVPASLLTQLIGVLLWVLFDSLFWARNQSLGGRERPLLLVLEEAHLYLSKGDSGPAAEAIRKVAKEGRKYGIGLLLVSQRPAEIDQTVLSQCGSLISLRLSNSADRAHIAGALSDNLEGLVNMLPVLRIGEAIAFGECVRLPVRLIGERPAPEDRPDSSDPLVYDSEGPGGWNRGREDDDYADLTRAWRTQNSKVERRSSVERNPVASSNVVSLGYDAANTTLEVEFKNGHVYQYYDVGQAVYDALMASDSIGQFINTQIKGVHRYARL